MPLELRSEDCVIEELTLTDLVKSKGGLYLAKPRNTER